LSYSEPKHSFGIRDWTRTATSLLWMGFDRAGVAWLAVEQEARRSSIINGHGSLKSPACGCPWGGWSAAGEVGDATVGFNKFLQVQLRHNCI
jgi:hypothetical protein